METVRQTKSKLPGQDLNSNTPYPIRLESSRSFNHKDFEDMFSDRKVTEMKGEKFDVWIVRRPEFDADLEYDHMLVAVPKGESENVWSFNELIQDSPVDANLILKNVSSVLKSYQESGASVSFAVLNTSSMDFGGIVDDNLNVGGYFRQPQSMMFVHIKTMGYKEDSLEERKMNDSENEYVHRPMQLEMNDIVKHLAEYRLGLEVVDTDYDANGVVVKDTNSEDTLMFFRRFHEAMDVINFMTIGGSNRLMTGMNDGKVDTNLLSNWATVRRSFGQDVPQGRVSSKEAVKNINEWLKLLNSESPSSGTTLGKLFEKNLIKGLVLENTIVVPLIEKYLETYKKYLEENPATEIPWGPFYSTLFHFVDGKLVASLVPAEIFRKGANTVTGIFPQESKISPTSNQKEKIKQGDDLLLKKLSN